MTLEDHLGDILRKARTAAGITAEAAARAAGLSAAQWVELEQTGEGPRGADWSALAPMVGLDAAKLGGMARGWLPPAQDLGRWRELRVISTSRGGNTVNSYLAWDEATLEAAVFDTGWDAAPILDAAGENRLQVRHLFLTHSHEDHVAALPELCGAFPKARLHRSTAGAPPQHRNRPNDFIHLGSLRITHRATPGHADDGVIYVVGSWPEDAPPVAIVGDTVFAGSMATGFVSAEQLKRSVREQIFTLPAGTLLCPGHGPLTTVAAEKAHNPFF